MDGDAEEVAVRLTDLVNLSNVYVSPDDTWMPRGKCAPDEVELDKADGLLSLEIQQELAEWWLAVRGRRTPVWDIASTCHINGKRGLILIEAKAYDKELKTEGKSFSSKSSRRNHEQIGGAIDEASHHLRIVTEGDWNLSRDSHYQLSNRFAWSWKLASLGIPVVLIYLGFLKAYEMTDLGDPFHYESKWSDVLRDHCEGIVDEACWGKWINIANTPFIPLIRTSDQDFDLKNP